MSDKDKANHRAYVAAYDAAHKAERRANFAAYYAAHRVERLAKAFAARIKKSSTKKC